MSHPDPYGAFMPDAYAQTPEALKTPPEENTPLASCRLAVKDIYDIEGLVTGAGSPIYAAEGKPALQTATAVRCLMTAGCQWAGKTVTDELTYSVAGINAHYGTPRNPRAPQRLCGGSSSGSAVAVAAGLADIGLGSDCGGSIRLPASYCGLYGLRPSHGRIASDGCFTLAHSYDTVSWFSRDLATLTAVFEVLARTEVPPDAPLPSPEWYVSDDILAELDPAVAQAFTTLCRQLKTGPHNLPTGTLALHDWQPAFRILQGSEIAQHHGPWYEQHKTTLGADIRSRFEQAMTIQPTDVARAARTRVQLQTTLSTLLDSHCFLLLPTVPGPAPSLAASAEEIDHTRTRAMRMLCLAGLASLPQVVLPWIEVDGAPVGLSLIGARGNDEALLQAAACLQAHLTPDSPEPRRTA